MPINKRGIINSFLDGCRGVVDKTITTSALTFNLANWAPPITGNLKAKWDFIFCFVQMIG